MVGRLFNVGACKKFEFYDILIDAMKAAGWKDISSNATVDFNIMSSEGESGDKNLIIQMTDWMLTNQLTSSVRTTDHSAYRVRFPLGYTPGEEGVAGVFKRPTTTWNTGFVYPICTNANGTSIMSKDTNIEYAIACNKDNVVIIITPPLGSGYSSSVTYFGLPDEMYTAENGNDGNDGLIFASSFGMGYTINTLSIANACSEIGTIDANISTRIVKCNLPTKNPNAAGKYVVTDILFEHSSEGVRGKVNSILFMPNVGIFPGDTFIDNGYKYKIAVSQGVGTGCITSFPSVAFAYRVE